MFSDLKKYRGDYALLSAISSVFVFLFVAKRDDPRYLMALTGAFATSYLLWGVWHHLRARSLSLKIILEYLLVSAFALILVATLLI